MPESAVMPSAARPKAKPAAWNRIPPAAALLDPNAHLEGVPMGQPPRWVNRGETQPHFRVPETNKNKLPKSQIFNG